MGLPANFNKVCFGYIKERAKQWAKTEHVLNEPHALSILDIMFHIRAWASLLIIDTPGEANWGREGLKQLFINRAESLAEVSQADHDRMVKFSTEILDQKYVIESPIEDAKLQRLNFARFYVQQTVIDEWKTFRLDPKNNSTAKVEWKKAHFSPGDQYVDACSVRLGRLCPSEKDMAQIQVYFWPADYGMFAPTSETKDRYAKLQELAKRLNVSPDNWNVIFPNAELLSDNPFWDARIPNPHSSFRLADMLLKSILAEPVNRSSSGITGVKHRLLIQFDKSSETSPLKCATTPRQRFPLLADERESLGFESMLRKADTDKDIRMKLMDEKLQFFHRTIDTRDMAPLIYQLIALSMLYAINAFEPYRTAFKDWEIIIDGAFRSDVLPDGRYVPRVYRVDEKEGAILLPERGLALANKIGEGDHAIPFYLQKLLPPRARAFVQSRDTDMVEYLCFYIDTFGKILEQECTMFAKSSSAKWGVDYAWDIRSCCEVFPTLYWGCPNLASFFAFWNLGGTDIVPNATPVGVPLEHFYDTFREKKTAGTPCPFEFTPPFEISFEPQDAKLLNNPNTDLSKLVLQRPLIRGERANFKAFVALYLECAKHKHPELQAERPAGPWYYELKKKIKGSKEREKRYLHTKFSPDKPLDLKQLQIIYRQIRVQFRFAFLFCLPVDHDVRLIGLERGPDGRSLYGFERDPETGRVKPATRVTGDHQCLIEPSLSA